MPITQRLRPVPEGGREIWLAGGCFWGLQRYIEGIFGVTDTDVGYANGRTENPTYAEVCGQDTGFAETVRVAYDPAQVSLPFLLELFYQAIDPTSIDRQGADIGTQYRSGIYFIDPGDAPVIAASLDSLAKTLDKPVAIALEPLQSYYLAESCHQDYLRKNPGGYCHIGNAQCAAARGAREYARPGDDALRSALTDLQYRVTRQNATEPPFVNAYDAHFEKGIYVDITTGEPLFASTDKFDAGSGWPAFSKPIDSAALTERADTAYGLLRTEVRSKAGDAHLGHVFPDGPKDQGGLRYCINSAALRFVPLADMEAMGYGSLLPLVE